MQQEQEKPAPPRSSSPFTQRDQINRKTLNRQVLAVVDSHSGSVQRMVGESPGRGWGRVSGAAVDGTAHWCIYLLVKRRAVFMSDLGVMLEVKGRMVLGLLLHEQAEED